MTPSPNTPSISICIATYNHRAYIEECVLSALAQTYSGETEILVGDDCSTDGTSDALRRLAAAHPGRLTVFHRDQNIGAARNYQDLMARAKGKYIAYTDGDDYWLPGKLAAQYDFLERHPECSAVYTNAAVINHSDVLLGAFNNEQPSAFDVNYLVTRGNFLNHSSMMFRTRCRQDILDITGEFLDYRVHLNLSRHGKIGYVNKCLVVYRATSSTSMIRHATEKVHQLYWEGLCDPKITGVDENSLRHGKAHHWGNVLYMAVFQRRLSYAVKWARHIRQETPRGAALVFLEGFLRCLYLLQRAIVNKVAGICGRRGLSIIHKR